jgi:hypothetical protein
MSSMILDTVQYTGKNGRDILHSLEDKMQFALSIRLSQLHTASYTGPKQLHFSVQDIFSMAAKRKRIMEDDGIAQELFLDTDLKAHALGHEILSLKVTVTKKRQRQTIHSLNLVYLQSTGLHGVPMG